MSDVRRTWRVEITRRDVYHVFVEATSQASAEEQGLEDYRELAWDDPEPYEREFVSVHAEETGY